MEYSLVSFVREYIDNNAHGISAEIVSLPLFIYTKIHDKNYNKDKDFIRGLKHCPSILSSLCMSVTLDIDNPDQIALLDAASFPNKFEITMNTTIKHDKCVHKVLSYILDGMMDPVSGWGTYLGSGVPRSYDSTMFWIKTSYYDQANNSRYFYFGAFLIMLNESYSVFKGNDTDDIELYINTIYSELLI